jgi:hypothetical protein
MSRRPNPLLAEFLDKDIPLPEIHWETVPVGVNPAVAWDSFDENIEGWVPVWFPIGDRESGKIYSEFERAYWFNDDLERILKTMKRWPLWGTATQKKHAVAYALLHLFCEVGGLVSKV